MTFYAMGDIHGQLALLQGAHALIAEDRARHGMAEDTPIVHLGDLVDRGPDSCGVVDHLVQGHAIVWLIMCKGDDPCPYKGACPNGGCAFPSPLESQAPAPAR